MLNKHMKWIAVRKEVTGTIMKTDIACEIHCLESEKNKALKCIDEAFEMFRDFENRYSRFIEGNELWQCNVNAQSKVSPELFSLLQESKKYYELTQGVFDPSVLPVMERSGYVGAYGEVISDKGDFSKLTLREDTHTVIKPKNLMIDLGGIGKGFVVDKVAHRIGRSFENILIDAGGDIMTRGRNMVENYQYWAIEIESPHDETLILLSDMAVATSGRNRRHWLYQGEVMHHLMDPMTQASASNDFLSVSVIAKTVTEADVFAKTVFILGKERGMAWANSMEVPVECIDSRGMSVINHYMEPYVWKSSTTVL